MKAIIAAEAIKVYADPNLLFKIYTDVRDYQMDAAIMQKLASVLSTGVVPSHQLKRIITVMCMKEYRNMLYGAVCTMYTNHKNLTLKMLSAQRVLR